MASNGAESSAGKKSISALLVSKTGNGKSSLANALLKTNKFSVGRGMLSGTVHCQCISTHVRDRDLTVVDTPGTADVRGDDEPIKTEIQRAMKFCPDGFDVFLLVIRCDSRFTPEERQAIEVAAGMFGDEFYRHAIIVFSHGDDYENDEAEFGRDLVNIRKNIPYLDELLKRCDNRYALVDNSRQSKPEVQDRQIEALLSMADRLLESNGSNRYTRDHLDAERRKQEEAAARKRAEEEAAERRRAEQMEAQFERRNQEMKAELAMRAIGTAMQVGMMLLSAAASSPAPAREPQFAVIHTTGLSRGDQLAIGYGGGGPSSAFYNLDTDSDSD